MNKLYKIPSISVCIAAYNAGDFLAKTLETLLDQTFTDFEAIVVDDGSQDATYDVITQYAAKDKRIKFFQNNVNCGLTYTRNRTLKESNAPTIAIADADDILHPERLEKQFTFLTENPEVGVVGTAVHFLLNKRITPPFQELYQTDENIRFFMRIMPCLWNSTTMYRKELLEQVGGYRSKFAAGGEDYDLWSRLFHLTHFANLPDRLVTVRVHTSSVTATNSECLNNVLKTSACLLKEYTSTDITLTQRVEIHRFLTREGLSVGGSRRAFNFLNMLLQKASKSEPKHIVNRFRIELSNVYFEHAKYLVYRSRKLSTILSKHALKLNPKLLFNRSIPAYLVRLNTPNIIRHNFKKLYKP